MDDKPQEHDHNVIFCFHCIGNSFSGSIDDVYDHWLFAHANESLSLPFRFYAIKLHSCFHCDEVAEYDKLVKHHQERHTDKPFAITDQMNRSKCGVCDFKDGDLIEHFKTKHDLASVTKIFNPVQYSEEDISKLSSIQIKKKQNQCSYCSRVFESPNEAAQHSATYHSERSAMAETASQKCDEIINLICSICNEQIDCKQLINHFRAHKYSFCCQICKCMNEDLAEIISHEKIAHDMDLINVHCFNFATWIKKKFYNTNIEFGNGLVLNMFNIQSTKFDESALFDKFIDSHLYVEKSRALRMIELKKSTTSCTANRSQSKSTDANVTENFNYNAVQTIATNQNDVKFQLEEQRKLIKNIFIGGIPFSVKNEQLLETVIILFNKLHVQLNRDDIEEVSRCPNGGVVLKLKTFAMKKKIFFQVKDKQITQFELLGQSYSNSGMSKKIVFHYHKTPFYRSLLECAAEYKKKKLLYSFKLDYNGLSIKRTQTSNAEIVRSKQELKSIKLLSSSWH